MTDYGPVPIDLPLDAAPIEILRLRFKYSLDDLAGYSLCWALAGLEKEDQESSEKLMLYWILENDIALPYDEALRKRS